MFRIAGVDYDEIGDSTGNIGRAVVVPMVILAALLAALTSWLGWWRPVLRDDRPTARWLWAAPALMLLGIAISLLDQ